jgi:hypothetical protein
VYNSVSSAAADAATAAHAAIFGGQDTTYLATVQKQVEDAIAQANSRIAELAASASAAASDAASAASSVVESATKRVKDEL